MVGLAGRQAGRRLWEEEELLSLEGGRADSGHPLRTPREQWVVR